MKNALTPQEIVKELDKHIVGQAAAKRAVAIAMRNRHRRLLVDPALRNEITPKNILMIGPTGVGKTEIARRLAKLANAPFIKVEATKFTEVGYVGRDVESIIRDLTDIAYKLAREEAVNRVKENALTAAQDRVLEALANITPPLRDPNDPENTLREKLLEGAFQDQEIEIDLATSGMSIEIMSPPGLMEMTSQLQDMFQTLAHNRSHSRKLTVKEALKILQEEEASKLVNDEDLKSQTIHRVEQEGIVFLDEIDKITKPTAQSNGPDVSREGVQRDLLPLVEGCTVSTRYGMVKTDHILFIASGAFHLCKPSDLIPELQGRLPIRVELAALTAADFVRILSEPHASLTEQYQAMLGTENLTLNFEPQAIERLAEFAFEVNERTENIGARRLHTIMERLLEKISFEANEQPQTVNITREYVNEQLGELVEDQDLSRFIL